MGIDVDFVDMLARMMRDRGPSGIANRLNKINRAATTTRHCTSLCLSGLGTEVVEALAPPADTTVPTFDPWADSAAKLGILLHATCSTLLWV